MIDYNALNMWKNFSYYSEFKLNIKLINSSNMLKKNYTNINHKYLRTSALNSFISMIAINVFPAPVGK